VAFHGPALLSPSMAALTSLLAGVRGDWTGFDGRAGFSQVLPAECPVLHTDAIHRLFDRSLWERMYTEFG